MNDYQVIRDTEIYKHIKDYLSEIPILELKKGEYLFSVNQEDDNLFYLLEGVIKIENVSYNGKRLIVDILEADNFVGHISKIHYADFQCSGLAETKVKVLVLKKPVFEELMKNNGFLILFYQKTSRRIYLMYKNILARNLFSENEIMAHYILENSKGDAFCYKSIYNICENLGISRRGIYNILHRFEEKGYLEKLNSGYRIVHREYLEAVAEHVIEFMKSQKNSS